MINNLPKANRAESVIEAKEKAQLSIQFGAYKQLLNLSHVFLKRVNFFLATHFWKFVLQTIRNPLKIDLLDTM